MQANSPLTLKLWYNNNNKTGPVTKSASPKPGTKHGMKNLAYMIIEEYSFSLNFYNTCFAPCFDSAYITIRNN